MQCVLGVDPGVRTGVAVIEPTALRIVEARTVTGEWERIASLVYAAASEWSVECVGVQVPWAAGRVAIWTPCAGSIIKNAGLSGVILGYLAARGLKTVAVPAQSYRRRKMSRVVWARVWQYEGSITEHARDAADIAVRAWQMLQDERLAHERGRT